MSKADHRNATGRGPLGVGYLPLLTGCMHGPSIRRHGPPSFVFGRPACEFGEGGLEEGEYRNKGVMPLVLDRKKHE